MSEWCRQRKMGIVFAMDIEARGLTRVLSHLHRRRPQGSGQTIWRIGEAEVTMVIGGVGRGNCRQATQRLIDSGATCVTCAGFAAALDDKASPGDILVADQVMHRSDPLPALACSHSLASAIPPSGTLSYTIWRADLVTLDSAVLSSKTKREVYTTTGAAALDMEAHACAEVCERRSVPFIVVKGISDTAEQDLPEEVEALASQKSRVATFCRLAARPTIWPDLLRLRRNALLASDNLGDVLGTMLLRLFG